MTPWIIARQAPLSKSTKVGRWGLSFTLHSMQDLTYLTRDRTWIPCSGSTDPQPRDHQRSPTSGFSDAIILSPPPQVVAKPFLHHLSQSTFQESDHTFQKTSQNMTGVLGLGKQVLRKPYNSLVPRLGFPISNKLSWENKGNCAVTIALNNTLTFSFYNDVIVI